MSQKSECPDCKMQACRIPGKMGPENCPTGTRKETIDRATTKMLSPEFKKMAYWASIQEGQAYMRVPFAPNVPSPARSRLEEIIDFSRKMGYKKLGVAYCIGVQDDAAAFVDILERKGFDVVAVGCHCGGVSKAKLGIKREEQMMPERPEEAMCHPIAQAEILNEENTDFNILMCLCIGHDSLFLKNSKAYCTVFAVKDRLFAHNPLAALWTSRTYHKRVLATE